jgi:hypothetical protein
MTRMSNFRSSPEVSGWISQFKADDQQVAEELLDAINLVDRDSFAEGMRDLILQRVGDDASPVGIYAERELRKRAGVPHRLFKQPRTKHKRATGLGPTPVQPTVFYNPHVGSEGLVAQIISEVCKQEPKLAISHPGPSAIRKHKVRRFLLVTDFVGSGQRALNYLAAAWRVRSVRSWWSARANKGLKFEILCYASTSKGQSLLASHASRPSVYSILSCPTIWDLSGRDRVLRASDVCEEYATVHKLTGEALGHRSTGALIAFAHGAPNNIPAIFTGSSETWVPLFPRRITSATRGAFGPDEEDISRRLRVIRQTRLAEAATTLGLKWSGKIMLLLMAALSRDPRTDAAISRKMGVPIFEVQRLLNTAKALGWITATRRLTNTGQMALTQLRKKKPEFLPLSFSDRPPYYPQSLRMPEKTSS